MSAQMKTEEALLEGLAEIKGEIQVIQIWIDDARTNRIARIRHGKSKERLRELVDSHKTVFKKYLRLMERRQPWRF